MQREKAAGVSLREESRVFLTRGFIPLEVAFEL
jgi:hypothetical protein